MLKNNPQGQKLRIANHKSMLFMPGDDLHKIQKGVSSGADAIIMDIEDGTALNRKQAARDTIREALRTVDFGRVGKLVRLNGTGTGLSADDLLQTIDGRPDGYVVPKVDSQQSLCYISDQLTALEAARGWEPGVIRLLAIIETALGVMNLGEIAAADHRLDALIFGGEDLAGDIGAIRTAEGWELFYARSAVVIAAAANNLQAIDTVFIALDDTAGLRADSQRAMQMGFGGKLAIHPRQVPIINAVFTPAPAEIERARRLIAAFEANQSTGTGAFAFDGKMVDMPLVRAAQRVLRRASVADPETS